jgi:hypothetical protein
MADYNIIVSHSGTRHVIGNPPGLQGGLHRTCPAGVVQRCDYEGPLLSS